MERVFLGRDEFEAQVLCDREGLTQEAAGEHMGVSRGTVQRLVTEARRKIADALLGEKALVVRGPDRSRGDGGEEDPGTIPGPKLRPL